MIKIELHSNISEEYRCKNSQQNTLKQNPGKLQDSKGSIPETTGEFNICKTIGIINHINGLRDRIHIAISMDKIQHPVMIKVLDKIGLEGTYLTFIKAIYDQLTVNLILSGGKLEAIPLKLGTTIQDCPHSPSLFTLVLEVLARVIRQKKEIRTQTGIGVKLCLFADHMMLYTGEPNNYIGRLRGLISTFNQVSLLQSPRAAPPPRVCVCVGMHIVGKSSTTYLHPTGRQISGTLRSAWSTQWAPGQLGLYTETLWQKQTNRQTD